MIVELFTSPTFILAAVSASFGLLLGRMTARWLARRAWERESSRIHAERYSDNVPDD